MLSIVAQRNERNLYSHQEYVTSQICLWTTLDPPLRQSNDIPLFVLFGCPNQAEIILKRHNLSSVSPDASMCHDVQRTPKIIHAKPRFYSESKDHTACLASLSASSGQRTPSSEKTFLYYSVEAKQTNLERNSRITLLKFHAWCFPHRMGSSY